MPGIRNKVALIKPPLTAPTYMATSNTNAATGSIVNVSGKASAISIVPVNPGTAPTVMPRNTPSNVSPNNVGDANNSIIPAYPPAKPIPSTARQSPAPTNAPAARLPVSPIEDPPNPDCAP